MSVFEDSNCVPSLQALSMGIYRISLPSRWPCFDGRIIAGFVMPTRGIKWTERSSNGVEDRYLFM